jgi:hypothetical protein
LPEKLPEKVIAMQPRSPAADAAVADDQPRAHKQPQDTAIWCRAQAEVDLAAAGASAVANGRLRFEHSAATWTKRADLLERLEAGQQSRGTKAV